MIIPYLCFFKLLNILIISGILLVHFLKTSICKEDISWWISKYNICNTNNLLGRLLQNVHGKEDYSTKKVVLKKRTQCEASYLKKLVTKIQWWIALLENILDRVEDTWSTGIQNATNLSQIRWRFFKKVLFVIWIDILTHNKKGFRYYIYFFI